MPSSPSEVAGILTPVIILVWIGGLYLIDRRTFVKTSLEQRVEMARAAEAGSLLEHRRSVVRANKWKWTAVVVMFGIGLEGLGMLAWYISTQIGLRP